MDNVTRLLGAIDWGGGYDELLPFSEVLSVGEYPVHVLTLEKLAEVKRHLSKPKDKFDVVASRSRFGGAGQRKDGRMTPAASSTGPTCGDFAHAEGPYRSGTDGRTRGSLTRFGICTATRT
jgi:hypothetical protein